MPREKCSKMYLKNKLDVKEGVRTWSRPLTGM